MQQNSNLDILPVNRTVVFYSPIEGEDVLVRTGTIAEGSCFFHSILYAYSSDYVAKTNSERMEFVKKLRKSIASKVNKDKWEKLSDGLIAKIPFQENVNNILLNFYLFVQNDNRARGKSLKKVLKKLLENDSSKLDVYKLLTDLLPLENVFEKNILPQSYKKTSNKNIENCKAEIVSEALKYFDNIEILQKVEEEKVLYLKDCLSEFLTTILNEAENSAFKDYISNLENVNTNIDSFTIELISDYFNRDIYFLDSNNRMPYYNSSTSENLKGRKSIVILWVENTHYEIVGRLLPGNKIQREFKPDDTLIKKLYTFLVNPKDVLENYPELTPYLPKDLRVDFSSPIEIETYMDDSDYSSDYSSDSDDSDYTPEEVEK